MNCGRAGIERLTGGSTWTAPETPLMPAVAAASGGIVYLSSTSVYGAHPDNPQALTEEMPARPVKGFQYSEDKLASEGLLDEYASASPAVAVCTLRCCPVMGANADNFIASAFDKAFLVAVSGASPPMQLIHEEDMVRCLTLATMGDAEGLYNLTGAGSISWGEMAAARGRRVFLSASVAALPSHTAHVVAQAAIGLACDGPRYDPISVVCEYGEDQARDRVQAAILVTGCLGGLCRETLMNQI